MWRSSKDVPEAGRDLGPSRSAASRRTVLVALGVAAVAGAGGCPGTLPRNGLASDTRVGQASDTRAGPSLTSAVPGEADASSGTLRPRPVPAAAADRGSVLVTVRWPGRQAQVLPDSTRALQVEVRSAGGRILGSRTLENGAAPIGSARFDRLPPGPVLLAATASSALGEILATGTASAEVLPSLATRVNMALRPLFTPVVSGFSPTSGGPGASVLVTGQFSPVTAPVAVSFGGVAVAPGRVQRFGATTLAVPVPEGATTGAIVVRVDGVPAESPAAFVTLASVSLSPGATTLSVGGTASFAASALDTQGQAVASPSLAWSLADIVGGTTEPGLPFGTGGIIGTLSQSGVFAATATGSGVVVAGSGTVKGTASVAVE